MSQRLMPYPTISSRSGSNSSSRSSSRSRIIDMSIVRFVGVVVVTVVTMVVIMILAYSGQISSISSSSESKYGAIVKDASMANLEYLLRVEKAGTAAMASLTTRFSGHQMKEGVSVHPF